MEIDSKMEKIVSLCKRRGFIFQGSEIYGGLAGFWDYGPYGVELKNNIKNIWWKMFVTDREDMFGIDAAIIMNPEAWDASGHTGSFSDPMVECKKCRKRFRWDQVEVKYEGSRTPVKDLGSEEDILRAFWICDNCDTKNFGIETKGGKGDLREHFGIRQFNMMFKTHIGVTEGVIAVTYLRPETAGGMFVNFKNIIDSYHPKLPFGLAQIGKAFRNEIAPRDFVFRSREFEQMEVEYFVNPENWETAFEDWRKIILQYTEVVGIDSEKVSELEVTGADLAHYSKRTIDFEFEWPFGKKELYGLAYRTDFDLKQHAEFSKQDLTYHDPETNEKFVPHVIEPSLGVDRTILAVLASAYTEDELGGEKRAYLKFAPRVAPVKAAVFPLLKNKPELVSKAREVYKMLKKEIPQIVFDDNGNIGKRYRRQDEIGTPFCITIDFDTLENDTVTLRDRDTGEQQRIDIKDLTSHIKASIV